MPHIIMPFRVPTIFRFLVILVVAFLLPIVFPAIPAAAGSGNNLVHMMLVFSLLIGFLINRALERKQTISTSVAVELSRLRRIQHMSEGMKDASWKKQLQAAMKAYYKKVSENFLARDEALGHFRALTHPIYQYKPKDRHEELALEDMLQSTREIALERQRGQQALQAGLSWYSWLVMLTYAALIIFLLLGNRADPGFSVLSVGATTAGILIVLDLLYRLNQLSKEEREKIQTMYKKNVVLE